jgi:hypothetical protein
VRRSNGHTSGSAIGRIAAPALFAAVAFLFAFGRIADR